jgi:hypothetical protein
VAGYPVTVLLPLQLDKFFRTKFFPSFREFCDVLIDCPARHSKKASDIRSGQQRILEVQSPRVFPRWPSIVPSFSVLPVLLLLRSRFVSIALERQRRKLLSIRECTYRVVTYLFIGGGVRAGT